MLKEISEMCNETVPTFGEKLDDILHAKRLRQKDVTQMVPSNESTGYGLTVVNNLINKRHPPRWMTYEEVRKLATALNLSTLELKELLIAFTCALLRARGLSDEL